jgi:hypothetical protein
VTGGRAPAVRAGAVAAVGFLLLDAVLLAIAGAEARRPVLLLWSAVLAGAAAGVVVLWRRYVLRLRELDAQRRAMRMEIEHLRAVVGNDSSKKP